jgi:glycosyltransferase involved in cell wall biosynthesis
LKSFSPRSDSGGLRLLYALGPGDAVADYEAWRRGEAYAAETSLTYSGDFYQYCRAAKHVGHAISYCERPAAIDDVWMRVENRPKRRGKSGWRYHLAELRYGLGIVRTALRWKADIVFADSGTTHWMVLGLLVLAGIPVAAVLHNTLWPAGYRPRRLAQRLILAADGLFWRRLAGALLSVSPECERQVRELAGAAPPLCLQYRRQYREEDFAAVAPPPKRKPFRVLFAGRVEENKGVFDLVRIAGLLERQRPGKVRFEVAGGGSAGGRLKQEVARNGLEAAIRVLGRLDRAQLLRAYGRCHAVIVPTRSDFAEGFAMVCAEAVLAGRPVITSPVVPAAEALSPAVALARTDDASSYASAIARLQDDPAAYDSLQRNCAALGRVFFDRRHGLAAALHQAVEFLRAGTHASGRKVGAPVG